MHGLASCQALKQSNTYSIGNFLLVGIILLALLKRHRFFSFIWLKKLFMKNTAMAVVIKLREAINECHSYAGRACIPSRWAIRIVCF